MPLIVFVVHAFSDSGYLCNSMCWFLVPALAMYVTMRVIWWFDTLWDTKPDNLLLPQVIRCTVQQRLLHAGPGGHANRTKPGNQL